jgi:hypothetical protein
MHIAFRENSVQLLFDQAILHFEVTMTLLKAFPQLKYSVSIIRKSVWSMAILISYLAPQLKAGVARMLGNINNGIGLRNAHLGCSKCVNSSDGNQIWSF